MVDYSIVAVTEPVTAYFSLKTAKEIANPIENVLIWPMQPVQMSERKKERLPSVVTFKTWQQIRKENEQEKSKMEEEKLRKKQLAAEKCYLMKKLERKKKTRKF